jgi:hypothetical protein
MLMRISAVLISTALFCTSPCWSASETPEMVVEQYHAAFAKKRWLALADYLHPDDLAQFKKALLSIFSDDNEKTRAGIIEIYGKGTTLQSLREGTDEAFLSPILAMLNERLDSANLRIVSQDVIGSVVEGEFVHVVYRWQSESARLRQSQVEVRTLRRYRDTWRLVPPTNLEGVVPALKRALQQ